MSQKHHPKKSLVYCWVTPAQKRAFKVRCAKQGQTMKTALLSVISPGK